MRIGIAGSGKIVATFLNAMKDSNFIHVDAICGRQGSMDKLSSLAQAYGIPCIYCEYQQMLLDKTVDTVYVAVPNSLHYEYAKAALLAGKNVVCEKPFTSTADELKELAAIARERKLFLFEAIITMYLPNYIQIKEDVKTLGQIKIIQADFSQYSSRYDDFAKGGLPIAFDTAYAGGALMDLNIYNLHFVAGLFGRPKNLRYYPNMDRGIDTSGILVMQYPGFTASLTAAKDCGSKASVKIQGTLGALTVHSTAGSCTGYSLAYYKNGEETQVNVQHIAHGMAPEFAAFNRAISGGDLASCYQMLDHSIMVMELCHKARTEAGIVFPAD